MIIAILLILAAVPPDTVALSLDAAIARALTHSPGLLAERAQARAAAQLPGSATRAFLPSVRAELQGLRTTDPVAVFGMKLRQGVFAANDLALDALNGPSAFGGFTTGIQAELPLLAPEGLFGYAAARRAAAARAAGTERAAGATVLRVTQAYWDTQLAAGRLIALDTALVAARAHERQAEAMRDQGLVTGLDARMARLQAASVEVQRLAAAAAADNARARLAAFLGLPDTSVIQLVDSLSERGDATCADTSPACTIDERGDLRALAAGAGAADLGAKGAWAAQLPQVAAFGAIARHAHDAPWGEGSGDWTVGIGVRWNVFPALSGVAAVRRARADADAARARLDAARLEATVEAGEARRMVASARAGAAVAGGAELEGAEALEQARLRYRTGSAPITELLDVQAAATQAVLTHQSAQRDLLLALALLDFAYGVHDR
jgi:outer membrane protein TolC